MTYRRMLQKLKERKEHGTSLFYPKGKLDVKFLHYVATMYNMADDEFGIEDEFEIAFNDMIEKAERWTDKDDDFPNNPSHYGWVLDGYVFITQYEGLAGCYWWDEFYGHPVCRP